jgi:hypothetical protein
VISGEAGTFRDSGLVRCDRNRRRSGLVQFLDEVQEFRKIVYKPEKSSPVCGAGGQSGGARG